MIDPDYATIEDIREAADEICSLQQDLGAASRKLFLALRDEDLQAMKARIA